jgi:hypothetical protein
MKRTQKERTIVMTKKSKRKAAQREGARRLRHLTVRKLLQYRKCSLELHHEPATAAPAWCQPPPPHALNRRIRTPSHPFGGHLACIKREGMNELGSS